VVVNAIRKVNLSREDGLFLTQLLVTLNNVEEAYEAMNLQLVWGMSTRSDLRVLYKFSGLLVVSVLLLLFSIEDARGHFPDLTLPVLFALADWTILALMSLANEVAELQDTVESN
jgi:hypothetical protein